MRRTNVTSERLRSWGRRPVIVSSVVLLEIASTATFVSPSVGIFIALRFLLGVSTSTLFLVIFVLGQLVLSVVKSLCETSCDFLERAFFQRDPS